MTVSKHLCDRCGGEITKDRTLLQLAAGPGLLKRQTVDLCPTHADEFFAWLVGHADGTTPKLEAAQDKS